MNQYGTQARRHWQTYLPERYRQLPDPEVFFTDLGEQIAQRVQELARTLAGPDPQQEAYLEKLGRLEMARLTAEDQVLREMLPEPETETEASPGR